MKIESTGKTVEHAIESGLKSMRLTREEVDIEVLNQGGFLKTAKVALTKKITQGEKAAQFLEELLAKMQFNYVVELVTDQQDEIKLNLVGSGGGVIGHRGETLDALQYLVSLIINGDKKEYTRITIDAEGYRNKRTEALTRLAQNLEKKVIRTGKYVKLEPMNPFERRIIHTVLQNSEEVVTSSAGEEPNRYVVISRKSNPFVVRERGVKTSTREPYNNERRPRREERQQRAEVEVKQRQTVESTPPAETNKPRKSLNFVYRSEKKKRRGTK